MDGGLTTNHEMACGSIKGRENINQCDKEKAMNWTGKCIYIEYREPHKGKNMSRVAHRTRVSAAKAARMQRELMDALDEEENVIDTHMTESVNQLANITGKKQWCSEIFI